MDFDAAFADTVKGLQTAPSNVVFTDYDASGESIALSYYVKGPQGNDNIDIFVSFSFFQ